MDSKYKNSYLFNPNMKVHVIFNKLTIHNTKYFHDECCRNAATTRKKLIKIQILL